MTTQWLIEDLKADEGLELVAYGDPLTGAEPWTIGYGHTGKEVHEGLVWDLATAGRVLVQDVNVVLDGLDEAIPWWTGLPDLRQDVVANMAFNMGVGGLLKFTHMLSALQDGDFAQAAAEMLDSRWAAQVPNRAKRLAKQMHTGERADD